MKVRLPRSLVAASLTVTMVLAVTAPRVGAVSNAAETLAKDHDHFSLAKAVVTASGTNFTFTDVVNGINITVTCASWTFSGKTPPRGLWFTIAPPTFDGCTDSGGGTDTVTTNSTVGRWVLRLVDAANDHPGQDVGDRLRLKIPPIGVAFTSSLFPGCTVAGPTMHAAAVIAAYDDVSQATIENASLPVGTRGGCSAGPTATINATYTLSPGIVGVEEDAAG